ncbi:DUF5802 family protein [Halomarina ordinaria]|uniref:DUF5802 family protein n=1 Tax=Halomarina ordinaria TaxID=3033939 RepID=A0ABD5U3K9_9EURY|nr:DUF5802 family protein [Halomarina sp. PSRA2]
MFEQFSGGYYLGRMYVEPYDGDRPAMQREQHEWVNRRYYASGEGVERLDTPLVMKLGSRHLAVHGEAGLPEGTLALPIDWVEGEERDIPDLREVLLAKADRAVQLLRMGTPVGI